jgi:hypothetical protein
MTGDRGTVLALNQELCWRPAHKVKLTVEFLGSSRRLTQAKACPIEIHDQATFREVLGLIATQFPALVGSVLLPTTLDLASSYMLNVDGRAMVRDLDAPAQDGQRLLLMFAEAGG